MNVIELRDVWKTFRLARYGPTTLFGRLRTLGAGGGGTVVREALRGVTLDVRAGERLGVVGTNGSGKTTLMRTICGIYRPTRGAVVLHGRVAAFLQLGIGMIARLTVRENVFLYGALLGLTRPEIRARFDAILGFAELESYADAEVRELSTGMVQRLTFSVAVQVEADVLLLDEILAVGDQHFKARCYDYFERGLPPSRAMVFASHDLEEIRRFCPRTLWLDRGRPVALGPTGEVLPAYEASRGTRGGRGRPPASSSGAKKAHLPASSPGA